MIRFILEKASLRKLKTAILQFWESGKLKNLSFMITGKLENMSRAEVKSIIEKNSGRILSSVSKKLNYLIVGEKPTIRKVNQAAEIGVKIINKSELIKLLN